MIRFDLYNRPQYSVPLAEAQRQTELMTRVIADGFTIIDNSYDIPNTRIMYLHRYVEFESEEEAALFKLTYL